MLRNIQWLILFLLSFQANYSWLSGLKINFHRFVSTNDNISLVLSSVNLNRSSHSVNNINMTIENSLLVNYQLTFQGSKYLRNSRNNATTHENFPSKRISHTKGKMSIKNCTFIGTGTENNMSMQMKSASGDYDEVTVYGGNQTISILDIEDNSDLMLRNSKFTGNSVVETKAAVLAIHQSKATVDNCTFKNNLGQEGGVIHAFVGTALTISNTRFVNNSATDLGGAIFAVKLVNVSIANSSFTDNSAVNFGGAIYSTSRTRFNISNTKFVNNNASISRGGSIAAVDHNYYLLHSCIFKDNSAGRDGAVLFMDQNNSLYINNSYFIGNIGEFKSGVMRLQQNVEILINNCKFVNNTAAFRGSVISAYNKITINITNSLFDNNTAQYVGVLEVAGASYGYVTNCTFIRNSVTATSVLYVADNTSLRITSCLFHANIGCLFLGVQKSELNIFRSQFLNRSLDTKPMITIDQCNLTLVDSTFNNNFQTADGGIVSATDSKISVTSCIFFNNHGSRGGVFYLADNSELKVDKCLFSNNTATDASVSYVKNSTVTFSKTNVINCKGIGYGGIMSVFHSKVILMNCNFSSAEAVYGGCLYLQVGSSLAAYDSVFEKSYAREGGAIFKYGVGNVSLTNCTLRDNTGQYGAAIYHLNSNYLRLAGGVCKQPTRSCITFELDKSKAFKYRCTLYTHNFTIESNRGTLNSANDQNFFEDAVLNKMIIPADEDRRWLETQYASRKFKWFIFSSHI